MASTSATLLGRLRDLTDLDAWREFERRYARRIRAWCFDKGLQPADADNVTQEVLGKVAAKMKTFVYTPGDNFSGLLYTMWHNTWVDLVRDWKRRKLESQVGSDVWDQLSSVAHSDLADHLVEECEREELHEAMSRTQAIVSERDWHLFWQKDMCERPIQELAQQQGISVAAAGMAVSRVRRQVKQQLLELRGESA